MSTASPGAGRRQFGGFAIGLVVGLLVGLALALGVALYITKAPVPFVNKVPPRTAEQDHAETERNRNWDPNAPLGGKAAARAGAGEVRTVEAPPPPPQPLPSEPPPPDVAVAPLPSREAAAAAARMLPPPLARNAPDAPAPRNPAAILDGAPAPAAAPPAAPPRSTAAALDPFVYFVQAGAFQRDGDAEQQRARLAMMGLTARVTEREQAGRNVYRVRLGPYPSRDEAAQLLQRLQDQGVEAQIVRVERS